MNLFMCVRARTCIERQQYFRKKIQPLGPKKGSLIWLVGANIYAELHTYRIL